ncbi:rhomboid family intramembrane serine protease [Devosia sp. ZB163]|uniref:rhomboid family intramembrane serine protease n=1 Tax=Devosia sp. ZB163 TaxID=3025938 RepID=UPI002360F692|nr:rhomboid family intramembrane serine protease [Devosia sp. ZB163]MDC9826455.1 rhomboid family intramembrane serine protease [Devosia sp. ZB163]
MLIPLHDRNPVRHIKFAYVTYGIIALNILVFLTQLAHGSGRSFDEFALTYAAVPAYFLQPTAPDRLAYLPDGLTLFTYAFFHADWLHLLSNMLFLWVFGDNIEDALGHVKFALFYLGCAALSGLVYIVSALGTYNWLIGASGAVAGVMGAYIVLYPHARVYVLLGLTIPVPLPLPALWMLGAWAVVQVFYLATGDASPVAWTAHIGGLLIGALLCLPLKRRDVPLFGGR